MNYRGYRIEVRSTRIGGRYRVVDAQQVVVREGHANTKRDAVLAAKDWVNSQ